MEMIVTFMKRFSKFLAPKFILIKKKKEEELVRGPLEAMIIKEIRNKCKVDRHTLHNKMSLTHFVENIWSAK